MPRLLLLPAVTFALLLALALPARAQGTISTDRPGFTFNPTVVPAGAFQIEVGTPQVVYSSSGDDSAALLNAPTQLRYGITPQLEARLFSTIYNFASSETAGVDSDADGFGDVELGLKYQLLTADDRGTPSLSLIPAVVIPTGQTGFSVEDPVINANVAAGFTLPSKFGLTVLAGGTFRTADDSDPNANLAVLIGRSFTPQLSGYVEGAYFPSDGSNPLFAGAGLAYLVSPLVQLDAFFDAALNDDGTGFAGGDIIGGIGISTRFGR